MRSLSGLKSNLTGTLQEDESRTQTNADIEPCQDTVTVYKAVYKTRGDASEEIIFCTLILDF